MMIGGIYFEMVIYFPYFVMEIKPFYTSKTFSIVPSLTHSCPKSQATYQIKSLQQKKCGSTNNFLNVRFTAFLPYNH